MDSEPSTDAELLARVKAVRRNWQATGLLIGSTDQPLLLAAAGDFPDGPRSWVSLSFLPDGQTQVRWNTAMSTESRRFEGSADHDAVAFYWQLAMR